MNFISNNNSTNNNDNNNTNNTNTNNDNNDDDNSVNDRGRAFSEGPRLLSSGRRGCGNGNWPQDSIIDINN